MGEMFIVLFVFPGFIKSLSHFAGSPPDPHFVSSRTPFSRLSGCEVIDEFTRSW